MKKKPTTERVFQPSTQEIEKKKKKNFKVLLRVITCLELLLSVAVRMADGGIIEVKVICIVDSSEEDIENSPVINDFLCDSLLTFSHKDNFT